MKFTRRPEFPVETAQKIGPFCEMVHSEPPGSCCAEQLRVVETELKGCGGDYDLLFTSHEICWETVRTPAGTFSRPVVAVCEKGLAGAPVFSPFIVLKSGTIVTRDKAGSQTARVDVVPAVVEGRVVRRSERDAPDHIEYLVLTRSVGRGGWTANWTTGSVLEGRIAETDAALDAA